MLAEDWATPWLGFWFGAFAAGSIPFGLIIGRARGVDIRSLGSGNIGATNVGRVLGRRFGYLCFALDALKGAIPTLWAGLALGVASTPAADLTVEAQGCWFLTALCAVLGHMFTPFAGFKGGKGVATAFGGLLAMWPIVTLPALGAGLVFAAVAKSTRYVSLGSIVASIALPVFVFLWGGPQLIPIVVLTTVLGAVVIWKHRSNIARLRAGTENRISA